MKCAEKIHILNGDTVLMENNVRIFLERLSDRQCVLDTELTLKVDKKLPDEGFRIFSLYKQGERTYTVDVIGHKLIDCGICVSGASETAVLYGLGKLLRNGNFKDGKFTPGSWRGASAPAKTYRVVYLASHFYNYYQCAPFEDMKKYLEDLALLGFNGLKLAIPGSLYSSDDKPSKLVKPLGKGTWLYFMEGGKEEREAYTERIMGLYRYGKMIGMKSIPGASANGGFPDTPEELRAVPPMSSKHIYDICPSAPGGQELILKNNEFRIKNYPEDFKPDYATFWPYDEGGCACDSCSPWGYNGMFRSCEKVAELYRKYYPGIKFIYATWLFDFKEQGEWEGLYKRIAAGEGKWFDLLLADSHGDFPAYPLEHGVPEGKELITFPEISMWGRYPWGAYGAIAMPERFSKLFGQSEQISSGGQLYSEGIFEDINKVVYASFFWNGNNEWQEAVKEYCRYEFLSEDTQEFISLIMALEKSHPGIQWIVGPKDENGKFTKYAEMPEEGLPHAAEDLARFRKFEEKLSPQVRSTWRWRQLMIRVEMDDELARTKGQSSAKIESLFEELERMYYIDPARANRNIAPFTEAWLTLTV